MGVVVSYFNNFGASNEPDPVTGLTPKEVACVQNSWVPIRKNLTDTGVELFMIYFKHFPEYQGYFPFRDIPYENLRTNEKLHAHAANVMYALTAILDNLYNTNVLLNLLVNSAKSHARRKITPKAYDDLKQCILELLKQAMGVKFTKEVEDAWSKTLTVAFQVIVKEITNSVENNDE